MASVVFVIGRQDPFQRLSSWADFPAAAEPRPVVLLGERAAADRLRFRDAHERRFPGWNKRPHAGRAIPTRSHSDLPEAVVVAIGSYAHLEVVDVRPTIAPARWTDRRLVSLPGWSVAFASFAEPFIVADPTGLAAVYRVDGADVHKPQDLWTPDAYVSADGLTVTARFFGYGEPYFNYPRALVHETDQAVTFEPVQVPRPDFPGFIEDYAAPRWVQLSLVKPLGGRVLVGFNSSPYIVVSDKAMPGIRVG